MPESRNNNVAITLFVICFEARILSSLTVLVEGIIYIICMALTLSVFQECLDDDR